MSYSREQYVKTAQQSFTDETGALRSGFYPVLDEMGDPVIVNGEVAVDRVWGNTTALQPNEDRTGSWQEFGGEEGDAYWESTYLRGSEYLGAGDSHDIALTEWQGYPNYDPPVAVWSGINPNGTTNYVVTGGSGRSYRDGDYFQNPYIAFCDTNDLEELKLKNVKQTLIDCGADPALLVDFTFSGGDSKWDTGGTPNYDGSIFWYYIDPNYEMYTDWLGVKKFGRDFHEVVIYTNYAGGNDVPTEQGGASWDDYAMVVFQCTNPYNNTANWWD